MFIRIVRVEVSDTCLPAGNGRQLKIYCRLQPYFIPMTLSADIQKQKRHFLPEDFTVTTWDALEPYFKALVEREIHSVQALEQWLKDMSEMEAAVSEDACW